MNQEKKDFGKWWVWLMVLLIPTIIIFSVMGYTGKFTSVYVERKVFETSYQRSESVKTEIATFEATLSEITHKLSSNLDQVTRTNLEAQASSIRIMLRVARGK